MSASVSKAAAKVRSFSHIFQIFGEVFFFKTFTRQPEIGTSKLVKQPASLPKAGAKVQDLHEMTKRIHDFFLENIKVFNNITEKQRVTKRSSKEGKGKEGKEYTL